MSCWEASSSKRPLFSELVVSITQTMESLADYLDVNTFRTDHPPNPIHLDVTIENSEAQKTIAAHQNHVVQ